MKTVLLLRHAKSDWSNPSLPDFERSLAKKGLKDAPRMGKLLSRSNILPELIVSSPARRAVQTAELVAENCGYDRPIQLAERLYPGSPEEIMRIIQQLQPHIQTLLLIGHNPALEDSISAFICPARNCAFRVRVPTAAMLCFKCECSRWSELSNGAFTLSWMLTPRVLNCIRGKSAQ
jgi:phosphohistidine phosphatase